MRSHNLVQSPDPAGPTGPEPPYVLSYFALRKTVGWIAIALPIVVFSLIWLRHACYQDSISAYYYTGTRNLFVGALCSIGLFLVACIGYREDRVPSIVAGTSAFLVAFCPTSVPICTVAEHVCGPSTSTLPFKYSPWFHAGAAVILFLTLAYFCLVLFRKKSDNPTSQKLTRNTVYLACGSIICVAIATFLGAELVKFLSHQDALKPRNLLFFVETICLFAFGFAWLVKGQQIMADKPGE